MLSRVRLFVTPWTTECQASLTITNFRVYQTPVHWVGDAIQPSHPLSLPSPPALNLSQHQGLFQWVSSSHEVAKVLEFQLQHQSFQWIFGVYFLWDWLIWSPCCPRDSQDLLQHHSSKASTLWHSAFFIVQLSHPYMTTRKTIALTIWTFVSKAISLLFNMLSRVVSAFFPRSKRLLISWPQSLSAVILEPSKIVSQYFHCFPMYLPWSDGTRCHDLSFLKSA